MGEGVDAMEQHDVVAGQQLPQAPIVRLAVGEMEVAEDRHLLQRAALGGIGGHAGNPGRVGMRPGDLDADTGLAEGGAMHRPADGRHVVPALDESPRQHREGPNVPGRADRGDRDPHQMAAIRRGAMRGP